VSNGANLVVIDSSLSAQETGAANVSAQPA
jgi:hypothetical protein